MLRAEAGAPGPEAGMLRAEAGKLHLGHGGRCVIEARISEWYGPAAELNTISPYRFFPKYQGSEEFTD